VTRARLACALGSLAALLVAGCVSVPTEPRALSTRADGSVHVQMLACPTAPARIVGRHASPARDGLDPDAIRVVSWNLHKQSDPGWQRDLRAFTSGNDIVLLQETVLDPPLRELIDDDGLRWVMASSFLVSGTDIGVLTASRVEPVASCTERIVEPLLRLPKSAIISWFPLKGRDETLAVVNVHAINFSLSLGAYRAQFRALGDALAAHEGPLILAGDLNTWTAARSRVVRDVAKRLGLTEVRFANDRRSKFFGHELDHIYTRGLTVLASGTMLVDSSDHNPVEATLRAAR
jgi:endonuclease/exonuclease/phosphatase (EEP) superfamily protein YafD